MHDGSLRREKWKPQGLSGDCQPPVLPGAPLSGSELCTGAGKGRAWPCLLRPLDVTDQRKPYRKLGR